MSMSIPHPHRHRHRHSMWSCPKVFFFSLPAQQTIVGHEEGGGAVAAACCRGLLCALWTLMALSCQFAFWLTNDTKWQAASGNWQLATAQAWHASHQALSLPLALLLPLLVIEPEAVNEAQNLKWKRIYHADWPGLLALLLPTRLVSIDFAFWCACHHLLHRPYPLLLPSFSAIAVVLELSLSVTNFIIIPNWVSLSIPQRDHPAP